MQDLAIVGIFYDGYSDLWEDFIELFKKNWPDCRFEKYIVDQSLDYDKCEIFTVIHAGENAEYSTKVQAACQHINAEYVLLLLDDFFIVDRVRSEEIERVFDYVKKACIEYCVMPLPEFKKAYRGKRRKDNKTYHYIHDKAEYTVSCQPAIWKKSFLEKCIGTGNYNAWVFEGIFAKSKYAHSQEFLCKCAVNKSNPLRLKHGVRSGMFFPRIIKCLNEKGYCVKSNRKVMSKRLQLSISLKSFVKTVLPVFLQNYVKRLLHVESVFDKYRVEIEDNMRRMELI